VAAGEGVRGSFLGGSALVDPSVLGVPYPNIVVAATPVDYVEWKVGTPARSFLCAQRRPERTLALSWGESLSK